MLASTFMAARALVLLGCGWIARRHAAAARRLGIPLLAASRDAARARAFAREFAAADAFGAYEDAVRDPRATGAIVCTPHDRHLPDALLALGAGLHVLRSEEHTSELQSRLHLVCRLLLEKKKSNRQVSRQDAT